jgi:hypothetical protein
MAEVRRSRRWQRFDARGSHEFDTTQEREELTRKMAQRNVTGPSQLERDTRPWAMTPGEVGGQCSAGFGDGVWIHRPTVF